MAKKDSYPATLKVDYPKKLDRFTTFFRILWSIPIVILISILSSSGSSEYSATGEQISSSGGSILAGIAAAAALMIVFRQRYPKWWFDFALELTRFSARVSAYLLLLTDRYPSTVEEQSVHLDVQYPNVEKDLNRFLPLVKWLLALPHYLALAVLGVGVVLATIVAWFAILFTGKYPKSLFNYVVGFGRWSLRVNAYAFLLVTDKYPPFSLK